VKNDTLFVFLAHRVPESLNFVFFKMAVSGHLGFRGQDGLKFYNNGPSGFIMPNLVKNDTVVVLLAHYVLTIFYFLFFERAVGAILNIGL